MNQNFPLLKLESIGKSFASEAGLTIRVLENINFEIPVSNKGTITSILAPFGSGKSTLLKIISGIIEQSSGNIFFNNSDRKKRIPLIPEKPSSFPWLNVKQNIEFGLNLTEEKKYGKQELISLVGLEGYENHFPDNKSLGFRFRISLARAAALNPSFILIDDSFKQMNNENREEIYKLLIEISVKEKQNFILATTNLVEAIRLSDRIFLMSKKPAEIIHRIEIDKKYFSDIRNHTSEIFTKFKSEIEEAFESAQTLTTINYSI